MTGHGDEFGKHMRLGHRFENWERSEWSAPEHKAMETQVGTAWEGKHGRIDLRLIDRAEGYSVLVETKATDWDKMAPHRVRPNALRHARQLWRYVKAELEDRAVIPALVYPAEPKIDGRREQIEAILHERYIQVVWRELDIDAL